MSWLHIIEILFRIGQPWVMGNYLTTKADLSRAATTQAFEGRLGQVEISEERQIFPLRQRHAVEYIQPGLALLGDAAHTIHPLAGQGVNLGFMDVAALTQVLQQAAGAVVA